MKEILEKIDSDPSRYLEEGDSNGCSPLLQACTAGDVGLVNALLDRGANIFSKDTSWAWGALHYAVWKNHVVCAEVLMKRGADLEQTDSYGKTAMHVAAKYNTVESMLFLLHKRGNMLAKTFENAGKYTPLQYACTSSSHETALLLVEWGSDLYLENDSGESAISLVPGDYYLMESKKEQLIAAISAIHVSARAGDLKAVATSLESNGYKELNKQSFPSRSTLLHIAAEEGHMTLIDYLISKGCEMNIADKDNFTPMHRAVAKGRIDVAMKLLENGARVLAVNKDNRKPFDCFRDLAQRRDFLSSHDFPVETLRLDHYSLWLYLVQVNDIPDFSLIVLNYVKRYPELSDAKDREGRMAVELASQSNKEAIQSVSLLHGRYRLDARPEHQSATCFVFKAVDENSLDDSGKPMRVAIKLMRFKSQFLREIQARECGFSVDFVIDVLACYPSMASVDTSPQEVVIDQAIYSSTTGRLSKLDAEKMFCIVMPLADRNMFVALKQERFAGSNMEIVRYVLQGLLQCVEHMHSKGYLHGDIKTLNIVRTQAQWKLLDLDACCVIGKDAVGAKSSSAYLPPEAIYVDAARDVAMVRSEANLRESGSSFELLIAHPSFDVWSLGCVFYQLATDARPLFQGGQDDNLKDDRTDDDSLWSLFEWSSGTKNRKLNRVSDPLARNLLSQMLSKDPNQRPSLSRMLAHPFLTNKTVTRLIGQPAQFDVFISYRVASDAHHVEQLHRLLAEKGVKVWWDKVCLEPGMPWEQGFCAGLVNSRSFVCLLSKNAINHPTIERQNFSKLAVDSPCDNVFLEHRLALELQALGLIEKVFPVMIGDRDPETDTYGKFFSGGCLPKAPAVHVSSVEAKLQHHMETQSLGCPLETNRTVQSVLNAILGCQGALIEGESSFAFTAAVENIIRMLHGTTGSGSAEEKEGQKPNNFNKKHGSIVLEKHLELMLNRTASKKDELRLPELQCPDNQDNSIDVNVTVKSLLEEIRRLRNEQLSRTLLDVLCDEGVLVPIRATDEEDNAGREVGTIRSGDRIEVYRQVTNGYFQLADGRGFVKRDQRGLTLTEVVA